MPAIFLRRDEFEMFSGEFENVIIGSKDFAPPCRTFRQISRSLDFGETSFASKWIAESAERKMTPHPGAVPLVWLPIHLQRFIHAADMGNDHVHEKFLGGRDRMLCDINFGLNDASQFREL